MFDDRIGAMPPQITRELLSEAVLWLSLGSIGASGMRRQCSIGCVILVRRDLCLAGLRQAVCVLDFHIPGSADGNADDVNGIPIRHITANPRAPPVSTPFLYSRRDTRNSHVKIGRPPKSLRAAVAANPHDKHRDPDPAT